MANKKKINFENINEKAMSQLEKFVAARVAIAKEDARYKKEVEPLYKRLESALDNREKDLAQGLNRDDVIRKYPIAEIENDIRKASAEHKENLKPLNSDLRSTYDFIPEGMHDSYVQKIESGKRGEFLTYTEKFLENLGIKEITQSALRNLAEMICDRLGVSVSSNKMLLEEGKLSSTLTAKQFNKLYMSVFCDILVQNDIIDLGI